MLTHLKAAGLFRIFILLSAAAVTLVPSEQRAALLLAFETLASFGVVAFVLLDKTRHDHDWSVAAAALLSGNIFCLLNHNLQEPSKWLFPMEEASYTIYILAAACYLIRTYYSNARFEKAEAGVFALLFAGFAFLSARYVLFPFFQAGHYASAFFYISSTLYRFTEAIVVAIALLLCMKARSRYWFYMMHGITLLSISSIALGYNTGVMNESGIPVQEYGWLWGILIILAAQTYQGRSNPPFARWDSARVRLVWFIFLFNVALLLLLYLSEAFVARDAFQLTSLLFIVLGLWFVANLIAFRISEDIYLLLDNLQGGRDIPARTAFGLNIYEAELFAEKLKTAYDTIKSQSQMAALAELSAQVAHDIRSPLAALDTVLGDTSQLPEEKRTMIRAAVGRIKDIANDLLEKHRRKSSTSALSAAAEPAGVHLLSAIIEPAITEKRLQFRGNPRVEIYSSLGPDSYGLFAEIQPVEFKRTLSNLINNGVESLGDSGTVTITLGQKDGKALVVISDNGKGIPPEILPNLGQRGGTHGKPGGSGLGLYHARTTIESWGGVLEIGSEPGKGATVTISLPRSPAPRWFVPAILLHPGNTVVVLDDDAGIHQVWQGRVDGLGAAGKDLRLLHFYSPAEFRAWVSSATTDRHKAVYLLDYELLGYTETGLSLAEESGIGERTILVTSRYEEEDIPARCAALGARMIPKCFSGLVPITIQDATLHSGLAVLLDDDALVRMNWKAAARKAGCELRAFSEPETMMREVAALGKDTTFYIDSELEGQIKGEEIAIKIKDMGFWNITLETGHPAERFHALPWLKISGKEPPWKP